MKLHYCPETDSLYIELAEGPGATTEEVRPGIVLDFDAEGRLVGIDIEDASRVMNLRKLEVESLPPPSAGRMGLSFIRDGWHDARIEGIPAAGPRGL
jgi:uncharacterized protein YuzE